MRMMMRRLPALTAAFALLCPVPSTAADLSPGRWPEAERSRLEAREAAVMPTASRAVEGRGLVAEKLVALAEENGVVIETNPVLAEALSGVELDDTIPLELYDAIAVVIGYVLQQTRR